MVRDIGEVGDGGNLKIFENYRLLVSNKEGENAFITLHLFYAHSHACLLRK